MMEGMSQPKQQTVLLGVTGSIAAYKACELLRLFQKAGLRVKVVMTEHAQELVGAATFRALSGEPVATDLFEDPANPIHHISLSEEADILVVAPCTANVLNKVASGVADDLLTTTALAATAPLVLAPAMNVRMLQNPRTQGSLSALEARGAIIVGPGEGYLACGDEDSGRMASPEEILNATLEVLSRKRSLAGKRVLVTAGPTREYLDPVRYISSPSSGRTGFALAREAAARGAEVVLVSGPTELQKPPGVEHVPVTTALEMLDAASRHFDDADIAIFSAAVADFRPEKKAPQKLKKGVDLPAAEGAVQLAAEGVGRPAAEGAGRSAALGIGRSPVEGADLPSAPVSADPPSTEDERSKNAENPASYSLTLTANPDILATLAAQRNSAGLKRPYIVGFAAETEKVLLNAQAKLEAKGADLIVANDVSDPSIGFASTHNQAILVNGEGSTLTEVLTKEDLAKLILDTVTQCMHRDGD